MTNDKFPSSLLRTERKKTLLELANKKGKHPQKDIAATLSLSLESSILQTSKSLKLIKEKVALAPCSSTNNLKERLFRHHSLLYSLSSSTCSNYPVPINIENLSSRIKIRRNKRVNRIQNYFTFPLKPSSELPKPTIQQLCHQSEKPSSGKAQTESKQSPQANDLKKGDLLDYSVGEDGNDIKSILSVPFLTEHKLRRRLGVRRSLSFSNSRTSYCTSTSKIASSNCNTTVGNLRKAFVYSFVWKSFCKQGAIPVKIPALETYPTTKLGIASSNCSLSFPKLQTNTTDRITPSVEALCSRSKRSISTEMMASIRHHPKPPRTPVSYGGTKSMAVTEQHSLSNIPAAFNLGVSSLGDMAENLPVQNIHLRNSKSYHGDVLVRGTGRDKQNQYPNVTSGSSTSLRQQPHQRKLLERQKIKMLKPLSIARNQDSYNQLCELGPADFSAAILPDSGTASYRLTHDVSFDEGTRYKNGGGTFAAFAPVTDEQKSISGPRPRMSRIAINRQSAPLPNNFRTEKFSEPVNRGRLTPGNHVASVGYKGVAPLSLIRVDERINFETRNGCSLSPDLICSPVPGSRAHSSQSGNRYPVATISAAPNSLRMHKERSNWNCRIGEISYSSSAILPGARIESTGLGSLSIGPALNMSQKLAPTRDRNGTASKSRLSGKGGNRLDSNITKDISFADPSTNPPSSFQQRLSELSMLESDTIKYERSRKLKRKSKQDKDC